MNTAPLKYKKTIFPINNRTLKCLLWLWLGSLIIVAAVSGCASSTAVSDEADFSVALDGTPIMIEPVLGRINAYTVSTAIPITNDKTFVFQTKSAGNEQIRYSAQIMTRSLTPFTSATDVSAEINFSTGENSNRLVIPPRASGLAVTVTANVINPASPTIPLKTYVLTFNTITVGSLSALELTYTHNDNVVTGDSPLKRPIAIPIAFAPEQFAYTVTVPVFAAGAVISAAPSPVNTKFTYTLPSETNIMPGNQSIYRIFISPASDPTVIVSTYTITINAEFPIRVTRSDINKPVTLTIDNANNNNNGVRAVIPSASTNEVDINIEDIDFMNIPVTATYTLESVEKDNTPPYQLDTSKVLASNSAGAVVVSINPSTGRLNVSMIDQDSIKIKVQVRFDPNTPGTSSDDVLFFVTIESDTASFLSELTVIYDDDGIAGSEGTITVGSTSMPVNLGRMPQVLIGTSSALPFVYDQLSYTTEAIYNPATGARVIVNPGTPPTDQTLTVTAMMGSMAITPVMNEANYIFTIPAEMQALPITLNIKAERSSSPPLPPLEYEVIIRPIEQLDPQLAGISLSYNSTDKEAERFNIWRTTESNPFVRVPVVDPNNPPRHTFDVTPTATFTKGEGSVLVISGFFIDGNDQAPNPQIITDRSIVIVGVYINRAPGFTETGEVATGDHLLPDELAAGDGRISLSTLATGSTDIYLVVVENVTLLNRDQPPGQDIVPFPNRNFYKMTVTIK
ncbi:hypothetical protein COTS27_00215 [Spirochaetota bacterium]|nr:hypothetical protein COTS27_00215 [Spirochaetota bacterium]